MVAGVAGFLIVAAASPDAHARRRGRRGSAASAVQTFAPNTAADVLHVVDADTAWFEIPGRGRLMGRFYGINAPECHKRQVRTRKIRSAQCSRDDEHFGLGAYRVAVGLLANNRVVLNCARDKAGRCQSGRFGRVLVMITVGGVDVMEALVSRGAAWTFSKYPALNHRRLCRLEDEAGRDGVGMWAIGRAAVEGRMSGKTRKWYLGRDRYCRGLR